MVISLALKVVELPFQLAAGKVDQLQQIDEFVGRNKDAIERVYRDLGFKPPGPRVLERMALGGTSENNEMNRVIEARRWIDEFEDFHDRKIKPKHEAGRAGSLKSATLKFADKIMANFDSFEDYQDTLGARKKVRALDQGLVNRFGKQRLIEANKAGGATQVIKDFDFFSTLDQFSQEQFGRGTTVQDARAKQKRFGTVERFGEFLGAGERAEAVVAAIGAEDLGDFGAGSLGTEDLQEDIFTTLAPTGEFGLSAGLQVRIEEARARRKAAFTAGQSQVATGLRGGQITQAGLF